MKAQSEREALLTCWSLLASVVRVTSAGHPIGHDLALGSRRAIRELEQYGFKANLNCGCTPCSRKREAAKAKGGA